MTTSVLTKDRIALLKSIAYTAISQQVAVNHGKVSFEEAKAVVKRWTSWDEDFKAYFDEKVYETNPPSVGKKMSQEAWVAFEFFELI